MLADTIFSQSTGSTTIPVAEKRAATIAFTTPGGIQAFKTNGKIILAASIGGNNHADTFNFRVFAEEPVKDNSEVHVFDPAGKTTDMLTGLGYTVREWKGESNIPLIIIGRDALSKNYQLPSSLENYVKRGGKAIIFNQQDRVLEKSGFRVAKYVSRYVFPIHNYPITQNLDEQDLRNWTGVGTLNTAYPDYTNNDYEKSPDNSPVYGWHWGNRGSVATNAMEKPHHSGWTPLLECEFDLAYSPLMELNYGKGKLIWCSLDVEDHAEQDPVAEILAKRIINYGQNTKTVKRNTNTVFIGTDSEKKILDETGLMYTKSVLIDKDAELIICGNTNPTQEKELYQYVEKGGRVLVLPKLAAGNYWGADYVKDIYFDGGKTLPEWDITNGFSLSDVRYRAAAATIKLTAGCDVGAEGLLGKKQIGKGEIIYCQIDPNRFNADSLTYFRFTRWRATRAFTQLLTNLGAAFACDQNIFKEEIREITSIDLDNTIWKAKALKVFPAVDDIMNKIKDPGMSANAEKLVKVDADETGMLDTNVPLTASDEITNIFQANDGEMVFRKAIDIPENMAGKDLVLNLASIDDFDNTFFNGIQVGFTDDHTAENWSFVRTYTVPAKLVKVGKNVIAIRIWDWYGGGGLFNASPKRTITLKEKPLEKIGLYHEDYRSDFELGDNPFRYFRW